MNRPALTNEIRNMLLAMGILEITKLTGVLNEEVNKVHTYSTEKELNIIFEKCEKTLSQLKSKYDQFKELVKK